MKTNIRFKEGKIETIVTDLRILKGIAKKYDLTIDTSYKYVSFYNCDETLFYKNNIYKIKYFDGCFKPYIVLEK